MPTPSVCGAACAVVHTHGVLLSLLRRLRWAAAIAPLLLSVTLLRMTVDSGMVRVYGSYHALGAYVRRSQPSLSRVSKYAGFQICLLGGAERLLRL